MSLLMEALRKAELANKTAPTVTPSDATSTWSTAGTEPSDQADASTLLEPRELMSEISKDTSTSFSNLSESQSTVELDTAPLALEPLKQAPDDLTTEGFLEGGPIEQSGAPENNSIPPEMTQPIPLVSELTEEPIATTPPESINNGAMEQGIMAEFDEEFAALVQRLEADEKAETKPEPVTTTATPSKPLNENKAAPLAAPTKPVVAPSIPARKLTAADATPSAAAGIFSARGKLFGNRTLKLALAGAVVITLFMGGGAYYVYRELTHINPPLASLTPPLQSQIEPIVNEVPGTESDTPMVGSNEADFIPAGPSIETSQNVLDEVSEVVETIKQTTTISPRKPDKLSRLAQASEPNNASKVITEKLDDTVSNAATTDDAPTFSSTTEVRSETEQPTPESLAQRVHVKRDTPTATEYQKYFTSAFQSYQAGNMTAAATAYEQALIAEPMSRDAMLGLAATSMRLGHAQHARDLYEQVLRLSPSDAQAATGLLNLLSESEPLRAESEIKFLLRQLPNVPDLYFALGNVYIKQLKWNEAQQAFASASSLDSTNPDYVFNLAVSFDQLGMRERALEQYLLAQRLAATQRASFDPLGLKTRIRELSPQEIKAEGS